MSSRDYLSLTKPRMVLGNLLVAAAGFAAAMQAPWSWRSFALLLAGLGLVIAGACVCNNVYDRRIDAAMERTKGRAVAAGRVGPRAALLWGSALFAVGITVLSHTNALAVAAAVAGFFSYVFLYTPLKHKTGYALYVGAFAGAMPPVVGYAVATGTLDLVSLALFVVLFIWQLPHFIAIALYRWDEYAAAGVPILVRKPATERVRRTAQKVFLGSLIGLTLACVAVLIARLLQ